MDHEIDLTSTGSETANMTTPAVIDDPEEDYPGRTIDFSRSIFVADSDPREQLTEISSFIDATNVYGYSSDRAYALRRLDGSGKLVTTLSDNGEDILPYNTQGLSNAMPGGSTASDFFLAGDVRSNENAVLTAMHTLFVREHNRQCAEIILELPMHLRKEEIIYQHARRRVSGIMQAITYYDFLPAILGSGLAAYTGYDATVDASIATEFSTVGYRLGHSMLSSNIRVGTGGTTITLMDAFFNPAYVQTNGADDLLIGSTRKLMQEIDSHIVEDVRSFLFGPPTATKLLDLASLNIQRGRDHGIPGYNAVRAAYGLSAVATFAGVTSDAALAAKLEALYTDTDSIDPWIGCLVEDHLPGSSVGPLVDAILRDQFIRLRDGDRYWYEIDTSLSAAEIKAIKETTLRDVIARNTVHTGTTITGNVFIR